MELRCCVTGVIGNAKQHLKHLFTNALLQGFVVGILHGCQVVCLCLAHLTPGREDLLTHNPEISDLEKDDMTLLTEILTSSESVYPGAFESGAPEDSFAKQWQTAFGHQPPSPQKGLSFGGSLLAKPEPQANPPAASATATLPPLAAGTDAPSQFLPSQLLDLEDGIGALDSKGQLL